MVSISVFQIIDFRGNLDLTTGIKNNSHMVAKISELVHQMQKERALTVALLNGKTTRDVLVAQRSVVDEKFKQLLDEKNNVHDSIQKSFDLNFKNFSDFRSYVDGINPATPEAVKKISSCVELFIQNQTYLAKEYTYNGIEHTLASLVLLEVAKENLGKVRAIITNVLAVDKPITPDVFGSIVTYYSSMNVNLNSPLIDITEDSFLKIKEIMSSSEWNELKRVINVVQEKSASGQYGEDPQIFFKNISALIDKIFIVNKAETDYVSEVSLLAYSSTSKALIFKVSITVVMLIFIFYFSVKMTSEIISQLTMISTRLSDSVKTVGTSASNLSINADQLSSSVNEQASALQETVSSLEEVRATVARNTEHTKHAQTIASKSSSDAQKGKLSIEDMLLSVNEINKSNEAIEHQVESNNAEFANIIKIISDIAAKTKVINDIVFQTKLLSFNASVEAARAGEHGKGFSVVAEEVGNLATMSGNAAKEISTLLESSTHKVNEIVSQSKERFSSLIANSKSKIQEGINTANECNMILDSVAKNSSELEKIVTDVTTASCEQSQGVNEIASAMNQMEQATQHTNTTANESAEISSSLRNETHIITGFVNDLNAMVYGSSKKHSISEQSPDKTTTKVESLTTHRSNITPIRKSEKVDLVAKKDVAQNVKQNSHSKVSLESKSTGTQDAVPAHDDPRFEEV